MGQEISVSHFKYHDFHRFEGLLAREMEVLHEWFREGRFSAQRAIGGLELETWIVDESGFPLPVNDELLRRIASTSNSMSSRSPSRGVGSKSWSQNWAGHGLPATRLRPEWARRCWRSAPCRQSQTSCCR
jgi:hypothetical protein